MPLEGERAFTADSPVGRYWLRNCVGFRVKGLPGGGGVVEEIGLGADGVDVLAVRRRNVLLPGLALVPADRIASVHPWDDTIVLAPRRRRAGDRSNARARHVARRLQSLARTAAGEVGHGVHDGAIVVYRGLAALGAFLVGLAVLVRGQMPHLTSRVSRAAATLKVIALAYAVEARRAWRAARDAIALWREQRREAAEVAADDGPLTRAGADDAGAHGRESRRRSDGPAAGEHADDEHDQSDHQQQPEEIRNPDAAADGEENQQHDQYQEQW